MTRRQTASWNATLTTSANGSQPIPENICLDMRDPVLDGMANQTGGVVQAQLAHGGGTVGPASLEADAKLVADIGVRPPLGDQLHHLPLARGPGNSLALAPPLQQRIEKVGRDPVRDIRLMPCQGLHGGDQVVVSVAFQQVAARARCQDVLDNLLAVVQGEDQNLGARQLLADFTHGVDAVAHRNGIIEDHEIGFDPDCRLNCLLPF
jgi:hypothetical protein